jgi:predicted KAP-like P-loop ATPase
LRGQVRPIKESVEEVKHTKLSLMMDIKEKESLKKGLKPSFQKLCRVWIDRARRLQKIRSEVAGIIELMTDPYC